MARNYEKNYSKLNRIILEKQREDERLRNPKRPRLIELNTVDEIKMWLPSIKKDLNFNLKQSQVSCYPERKIKEFHTEIARLEKEYKAFVRKLHSINPKSTEVPWTDRPYCQRKRKHENDNSAETNDQQASSADVASLSETERLSLPILQSNFEHQYTPNENVEKCSELSDCKDEDDSTSYIVRQTSDYDAKIYAEVNTAMQDAPLSFKPTSTNLNRLALDYDSSGSDDT